MIVKDDVGPDREDGDERGRRRALRGREAVPPEVPERPSSRLGRPVPADLERVIMKCLEKHASARYANVTELERDLSLVRGRRRVDA